MSSAGADLGMKPAAPNCWARRMMRGWSLEEMMTTGISGYSPRTCSSVEKPRAPGMVRSSSTSSTSGWACSVLLTVMALAASSVWYCAKRSRSTCSTAARNRGWSSATSKVGWGMARVCHAGHIHTPCRRKPPTKMPRSLRLKGICHCICQAAAAAAARAGLLAGDFQVGSAGCLDQLDHGVEGLAHDSLLSVNTRCLAWGLWAGISTTAQPRDNL